MDEPEDRVLLRGSYCTDALAAIYRLVFGVGKVKEKGKKGVRS